MSDETVRVTMVPDAIHNPGEPRHFMKLVPVSGRAKAMLPDGTVLADSGDACFAVEIGRDFYPPVVYFPRKDVCVELIASDRLTHCPLKGDASYYSVAEAGNAGLDMVWAYEEPIAGAETLAGLVAFYPDRRVIEVRPD